MRGLVLRRGAPLGPGWGGVRGPATAEESGGEGRGGCAEEQLPSRRWVWAALGKAAYGAGLRVLGGFLPSSLHRWFAL